MKKKDTMLLIGAILIALGAFIFFKTTWVSSWGFYHFGNVSTGGILIALALFDLVFLVATRHKLAKVLLPILLAMLMLSVVLGTHLHFSGSVLDLFLMLAPAAVGTGLVLRAMFMKE